MSVTRIAFDYQIFTFQKYGGISRYFYEITSHLAKDDAFNVKIYAGLHQNKYINSIANDLVVGSRVPYLPKTSNLFIPINTYLSRKAIEKAAPDVIHETYYSKKATIPFNVSQDAKVVITVHDMILEKFCSADTSQDALLEKRNAIKRADHIICVSENTRKDLLELFDISVEKISTIYHGYSLQNSNQLNTSPIVNTPYILYVGDWRSKYKNFGGLLNAYGRSRELQNEFKLVCIGPRRVTRDIFEMVKRAQINKKNILYLSGNDSVLANLYQHASAFVYPSLYEGFGISPLEAMSFCCPVICSNTSSIPEVVSDAGYYFDPYDVDSISHALEKVLFSSELRKSLITKGKERVQFFSWEKCAIQTGLLYQQLA